MYTYKRFKASKSAVIIILIALALVIWGILGLTGTPLAKKRELVTFELKYVSGPLAFVPQPLTISCPVPPGSTQIGDHDVVLDVSAFGKEAKEPGHLLLIEQDKQNANEVHVTYWFTDAQSGVKYQLGMLGTFDSDPPYNWLPAPGSTTFVNAAEGENWMLSPSPDKRGKSEGGDTETGNLDWTLEITCPN